MAVMGRWPDFEAAVVIYLLKFNFLSCHELGFKFRVDWILYLMGEGEYGISGFWDGIKIPQE